MSTISTTLQQIINNDPQVKELFLQAPQKDELIQLSTGLKTSKYLTQIQLNDCNDMTELAEALKVNRSLTWLTLYNCNDVTELAEALKVNCSLKSLGFYNNNDKSDNVRGVHALAAALKSNVTLIALNLNGCNFKDITALATVIKVNRSLTVLGLGGNTFGDTGSNALAAALKVNVTLTSLNLRQCDLKDISELAKTLQAHRFLQHLSLCCNRIAGTVKALGAALKKNVALITLTLQECDLEDVTDLAEALKFNHSLTYIDLYKNQFGDTGGNALGTALKVNVTLTELNLGYCGLKDITGLAEGLKINRSLKNLYLCFNQFDEKASMALGGALKMNVTLTSLNLVNCNLKEITELAEGLKSNRSLRYISFAGNEFGEEGGKALTQALEVHTVLTAFDLNDTGLSKSKIDEIWEKCQFNRKLALKKENDAKEGNAKTQASSAAKKECDSKEQTKVAASSQTKLKEDSIVNPIQPTDTPKTLAETNSSSVVATQHAAASALLDLDTVQKLKMMPEKHEALAKKFEAIDAATLQLVQNHVRQLPHLFEMEAKEDSIRKQQAQIDASPALQTYHHYFSRLLTGTWMACQSINSGMIDNDEMSTSDYVGQGLNKIGEKIPGINIVTGVISGSLSAWNYRDKKKAVQRMALLFPDLPTAFTELGKLAREITLERCKEISSIKVPESFVAKLKEKFKSAKTFILADDADTPFKRMAIEDCQKLLVAIKEGKLSLKPTMTDFIKVIMGREIAKNPVHAISSSPSSTTSFSSSSSSSSMGSPTPPTSASSISMEEIAQKLQEMEEMRLRMEQMQAKMQKMEQEQAKLKEKKPQDHAMEFGGDQAQAVAPRTNPKAAVHRQHEHAAVAELHQEVTALKTHVTIVKATQEEHGSALAKTAADLAVVQKKQPSCVLM